MLISGYVTEVKPDRFSIEIARKQIVDIFYTKNCEEDVKELFVNVYFEGYVILQEIRVGNERLAKLWLQHIHTPRKIVPSLHKVKNKENSALNCEVFLEVMKERDEEEKEKAANS